MRNYARTPTIPLLSYDDLAKRLNVAKGTLCRRIKDFNARAVKNGTAQIVPDEVRPTTTVKHLYKAERLPELKRALADDNTRKRGRPRKGENPS